MPRKKGAKERKLKETSMLAASPWFWPYGVQPGNSMSTPRGFRRWMEVKGLFVSTFLTRFRLNTQLLTEEEKRYVNLCILREQNIALVRLASGIETFAEYDVIENKRNRFGAIGGIRLKSPVNGKIDRINGVVINGASNFVILRNSPEKMGLDSFFTAQAERISSLLVAYDNQTDFKKMHRLLLAEAGVADVMRDVLRMQSYGASSSNFVVEVQNAIAYAEQVANIDLTSPQSLEEIRKEIDAIINETLEYVGVVGKIEGENYVNELNVDFGSYRAMNYRLNLLNERERMRKEALNKGFSNIWWEYIRAGGV